ncbi:MAG: tetratricopeptide repeat protein [Planctomycetota bacterium]|nr:tetratricopeptide repeat protein [Planctomycetota bacterium]
MSLLTLLTLLCVTSSQESELDRILRLSKQERRNAKTEGEYSKSIREYRKALENYLQENPTAPDQTKASWFHAESYLYTRELPLAIIAFDEFTQKYPQASQVATAKFAAAEICMRLEQDEEARRRLLSWQKEFPNDKRGFQVSIFLAALLIFEKKFAEAASALDQLRQSKKGSPEGWSAAMQLAACYHVAEKNAEAIKVLKDISENCPDKTLSQTARQYQQEYAKLNRPLPSQKEKDKEGETLHLGEHLGKVVILYFYTSRLPIAESEVEFLRKTYAHFSGKEFVILGICVDPERRDFLTFRRVHNVPWTLYYDGAGRHGYLARLYAVGGIPDLRVLDRKGKVRFYNVSGRDLRIAVEKLLSESQ